MKKRIIFFLLTSFVCSINAQEINEKKAIQTTIENFFKGFHKGDVTLLKTTIHKDLYAQTVMINSKGESAITPSSKAYDNLIKFAQNVKPTDTYFEKILSYTIHVDQNLASVWTPYEFYNQEKFSHCGSNSFQLFKSNGKWKIVYLVDNRKKDTCKALGK
ncbi:MAG: nuclear transport factor 2 family protein [Polaribacter sp.]|nr:nuclear transport factor 2 family protein [Polaribacter sp.]MDG1810875.1 nuclear transport factor 2 family protein [Polaribacter sp.]MDG1993136.1 nuclear transport factor 2 family protein [Polaribacter sp.]